MKIDPAAVPEQFRYLIPLAEQWGINDDGYRIDKIEASSQQERAALIAAVLPVTDRLYLEWLGDAKQLQTEAADAYIAFTALILAAEYAAVDDQVP